MDLPVLRQMDRWLLYSDELYFSRREPHRGAFADVWKVGEEIRMAPVFAPTCPEEQSGAFIYSMSKRIQIRCPDISSRLELAKVQHLSPADHCRERNAVHSARIGHYVKRHIHMSAGMSAHCNLSDIISAIRERMDPLELDRRIAGKHWHLIADRMRKIDYTRQPLHSLPQPV